MSRRSLQVAAETENIGHPVRFVLAASTVTPNRIFALEPLYQTPEVGKPIELCRGPFLIETANRPIEARGKVELQWQPYAATRATLQVNFPDAQSAQALTAEPNITIMLTTGNAKALINRHSLSLPAPTLNLRVTFEDVEHGNGDALSQLRFHVINGGDYFGAPIANKFGLTWTGRLTLKAQGRCVTLDTIKNLRTTLQTIEEEGGYTCTHAGLLTREDGASFDINSADSVLSALFHCISFAFGRWCPIVLPVGFNAEGGQSWFRWHTPRLHPWKDSESWFNSQRPASLNSIFERLLELWTDEGSQRATRLALYWYMMATENPAVDASIVLSQIGLELLAWFWLVETEKAFSASFDGLRADEKVRHLLKRVELASTIPKELPALRHWADAQTDRDWDGPRAITFLRNGAVHPKRREATFGAPEAVRNEAAMLSLWYFELTLLRFLGYRGLYINRLMRDCVARKLPWDA